MSDSPAERRSLPFESPSATVPTFGCIVYVSSSIDGRVRARVANLCGLAVEAATERDALSQLVPLFRQHVRSRLESGGAIEWIEPPLPIGDGEKKRFLPVHL